MSESTDHPLRLRISNFIATGFFSGYSPFAPGTAGTAVAAVLFFTLEQLFGEIPRIPLAVVTTAIGIFTAHEVWKAGIYTGGRKKDDPQQIVVDEFAGYAVTIIGVTPLTLGSMVLTFFLFRVFDVLKPWPIKLFEKLPGGWGIVLDDVVAGIYAFLSFHVIVRFAPSGIVGSLLQQ